MSKVAAKRRLVDYESNPFNLVFSVIPTFSRHFQLFARTFWLTALISLGVTVLVILFTALISTIFRDSLLNQIIVLFLALLIITTFAVALAFMESIFINLALVDLDAEKLNFWQLVEHSRSYIIRLLYLQSVLALVVFALTISIVGILFLPYVIARFMLAQFVAVHENRNLQDSISRSGELMRGRLLDMLGLLAASSIFYHFATAILVIPIVFLSMVTGIFAAAVINAWAFSPVLIAAFLLILFIVVAISFILTLATGKRYLQLRDVVDHKLRVETDISSNVIALAIFFIICIFSFLTQLIIVGATRY